MYFCYPLKGPGLKEHSVEDFHLKCFEKCENWCCRVVKFIYFITTNILIVDVVSRHYQYALKVVGRYAATV